MKRKIFTRKVCSVALAIVLAATASVSMSATALAAGGTWVYTDSGAYTPDGKGAATPDGTNPNTYDIDVNAKTSGGGDIVYSVTVTWGDMNFEYNYGSTWDPATHSYNPTGAQGGKWVDTYVNGTNNKISVTNDSNFPIDANFRYAHNGGVNPFGVAPSGHSVGGVFSGDNATILGWVAANTEDPVAHSTETMTLNMVKTGLTSREKYYYKTDDNGTNTGDMYFALLGTPARGLGMTSLQSVGKITVTITPSTGVTPATKP